VPHVELTRPVDLPSFHRAFAPRSLERAGTVLRISASFLSHDGRTLLLECLTVEGYLRQTFFVLVSADEGHTMVRLLPRTSPEKTEAVKTCVVWTAHWLRRFFPGIEFGRTNLGNLLEADLPVPASD
jgi:hypothetical protein